MIYKTVTRSRITQHVWTSRPIPWGITCNNVGIKDVIIPDRLSDAMSRQAQAERERQARIILGTAETEIAEKFAKASEQISTIPRPCNCVA